MSGSGQIITEPTVEETNTEEQYLLQANKTGDSNAVTQENEQNGDSAEIDKNPTGAIGKDEANLRRSERSIIPSLKLKENYETQFWEVIETMSDIITKIRKNMRSECSVSVKMSMEREIERTIIDLDIAYDRLRSVFKDGVPDAARVASDRFHGDLQGLLHELKMADEYLPERGGSVRTSSTTSSKRALLAAKAAALKVELEAKHIETQQELELASLHAKEQARQAEVQLQLERRRREIEGKKLEMKLKETEAEMSALEQSSYINVNNATRGISAQRHEVIYTPAAESTIQNLTRSFSESLNLSRLPAPEPFVFDGEPLKYPAWKAAFISLIDHKGIPSREKLHYLRKYLSGDARESIEGLFFFDSEEAYSASLKMLEERYGNPFLVAEGFRNKIDDWPRIQTNDSKSLRNSQTFCDNVWSPYAISQVWQS